MSAKPYFYHTTFPPLISTFRSRHSVAVLGTRGCLSNDSCVTLSTSWLFGPLCRKCRQTPILIIPLSPHCFHFPQSALNDRAGGARLAFERLGCRSRRELAVLGLCKNCRQTPILFLIVFSPFFSSHFSQLVLRGRAGDARLDFERPGVRGSGGLISDTAGVSQRVCRAWRGGSSSRCSGMFWEG